MREILMAPVSSGAGLEMASLTREYHPRKAPVAAGKGSANLELHTAWVTLLVDVAIRALGIQSPVARLDVTYCGVPQADFGLALRPTLHYDEYQRLISLGFEIIQDKRILIATGTVTIDLKRTPDPERLQPVG